MKQAKFFWGVLTGYCSNLFIFWQKTTPKNKKDFHAILNAINTKHALH
jgi:hypothetical protein